MPTYGTTVIPSDEITVESGDTVDIGIGINASVGIVGSFDSGNGSATPGEVTEVTSTRDARDKFGDGSELHRAVEQAYANGAVTIHAVGLPSTETTESELSASGTLNNVPLFDPRVTSHEITVQDTTDASSETVVVSYEDTLTSPDSGEFKVNPLTGDFQDDGDGNSYDITYSYTTDTEYVDSVTAVADEDIRYLVALTEDSERQSKAVTEATTRAQEFDFFRVVSNVAPNENPSTHTDSFDEARLSLVAPARGYAGSNQTEEVRTAATVAGRYAGNVLGDSATYESLSGLLELNKQYTVSQLGDWVDKQVAPIQDASSIRLIKDMTTSQDGKFERVYANEIIDEATAGSHLISQNYVGELNTEGNRRNLEDDHTILYRGFEENEPTLLDEFSVSVTEDSTNSDEVNVDIGLNVVDIIDTVDVSITVGDVITAQQG